MHLYRFRSEIINNRRPGDVHLEYYNIIISKSRAALGTREYISMALAMMNEQMRIVFFFPFGRSVD